MTFLAEEPRIGRLATTGERCRPHVVPVWYRVSGDEIWVHTLAGMRKARNVEATGRFALTVDTEQWPYRGVMIEGPARAASSDEIDHRYIEDVAVAYLGEPGRGMGTYLAELPRPHVTLVLAPERWQTWDYAA